MVNKCRVFYFSALCFLLFLFFTMFNIVIFSDIVDIMCKDFFKNNDNLYYEFLENGISENTVKTFISTDAFSSFVYTDVMSNQEISDNEILQLFNNVENELSDFQNLTLNSVRNSKIELLLHNDDIISQFNLYKKNILLFNNIFNIKIITVIFLFIFLFLQLLYIDKGYKVILYLAFAFFFSALVQLLLLFLFTILKVFFHNSLNLLYNVINDIFNSLIFPTIFTMFFSVGVGILLIRTYNIIRKKVIYENKFSRRFI